MVAPVIRRFTASISALNTAVNAVDNETNLTYIHVSGKNQILDVVNDPDPVAGNRYVIAVYKGGRDTGVRFYSSSMSAGSAGRVAVGPIDLLGGDYQFRVTQVAGTAADFSFIVKFLAPPQ